MKKNSGLVVYTLLLLLAACGSDSSTPSLDGGTPLPHVGTQDELKIAADGLSLSSTLHYPSDERGRKRIAHRAEWRDAATLPANTVIDYAITLKLPADFPHSSMSVALLTWYDRTQSPVLQISTARQRFWTELLPSSAHEPVYKPFPADLVRAGVPTQCVVSAVWSAEPDRGRILMRCNGVDVFRYRGVTLPQAGASVPYAAIGLSYAGSGKPTANLKGDHRADYSDYRRRIGAPAEALPPLPALSPQRRVLRDDALAKVPLPAASALTPVPFR